MARIKQEHAVTDDGWSRWVQPIMRGYKMVCCDCGLVHDMEFNALRVLSDAGGGRFVAEEIDGARVEFRARRNGRSTAAVRREKRRREGM